MTGATEAGVVAVAGVILAGGAATRIGGEKALLPFRGSTLLDAVIARVTTQAYPLTLNVPAERVDVYRSRYPNYRLLFDPFTERVGPLGGVIAGLEWAQTLQDVRWLASFPCDTPFLPHNLVAQLMASAHEGPVFAHDGEGMHGTCAAWPVGCIDRLRKGVVAGRLRSVHSAMQALRGATRLIQADPHAFFNINTPGDLARAEDLARSC